MSSLPPGGLSGQILFSGIVSTGDPSTLPNLAGWWRADTVVLSSGNVSQLTDLSGNGNHFLQATGSNQPLWLASSPNFDGQPALSFNGTITNSWMAASGITVTQPYTVYLIAFGTIVGTTPVLISWGATNSQIRIPTAHYSVFDTGTDADIGVFPGTTAHVFCMSMAGASPANTYYVDNSETTAATSSASGTQAFSLPYIGNSAGILSTSFTGQIAEIITYSGAHTEAQRKAVMSYAAFRYGVPVIGPTAQPEWRFAAGDVIPSGIGANGLQVAGLRGFPLGVSVPGQGATLLFGGVSWLPIQSSGDVLVSVAAKETVVGLQNVAVSATAPTAGQVLTYHQGFVPTSIGGLTLWLRSDSLVLDGAGLVSQWTDKSGNGHHAMQTNAAVRPGYVGSDPAYGGLPSLLFSSSTSTRLHIANLLQSQPFTAYVVCNSPTSVTGYVLSDDGATADLFFVTSTRFAANFPEVVGTTVAAGVAHVVAITGDGAHTNNVLYADTTTGAPSGGTGTWDFQNLTIGRIDNGASGQELNGTISEILIYSGAHTGAQIASVMGYLGARYGLTVTGATAPGFTGWAPT